MDTINVRGFGEDSQAAARAGAVEPFWPRDARVADDICEEQCDALS